MACAAISMAQAGIDIIKEVQVRGLKRVREDAVLAEMRLKPGQAYLEELRERDEEAINNMGYFSKASVTAVPAEAGAYRIIVDVEEYETVKEIRIAGNTIVPTQKILDAITVKPGQLFNLNAANGSRRAIEELYQKAGAIGRLVQFEPLTESPSTLSVVIAEVKVGTVSVLGPKDTKDRIFRRLIRTRTGEVYREEKVVQDLRRMLNTNWFVPGSLDVQTDATREENVVDLTYLAKEDRTGNFQFGLQVDPRNSFAGVVNLRETNFRGRGESVGIDFLQAARVGGPSISIDYGNPYLDDKDTSLRIAGYSRIIYRFAGTFGQNTFANSSDYFERRTGGTVGLSRTLRDRPMDQLSAGASVRYESVKTNVPGAGTAPIFTNLGQTFVRQDGTIGVLTLGTTLNQRDSDLDPSRGQFLSANLEPGFSRITDVSGPLANQTPLGSSTFVRASVDYRRYFTDQPARTARDIDAPRRVLALRLRGGTITGRVPFFEQFFAGGAQSVRGYNEDQFWGKNQLITSAEYRYPIQRSFNVIAFVDYGGAWGGYPGFNGLEQSSNFKMHLGYGLGLSVRTPLGPIRFDFGFNEQGRTTTHFLIGTSF